MKSFSISLTLFMLLAVCMIANVIFIHDCADRIKQATEELSVPTDQKLCELEELWSSRKKYIGLSVSEKHLDNVSQIMIALRSAYESGDDGEFKKNLALLTASSDEIKKYECLSIENIF